MKKAIEADFSSPFDNKVIKVYTDGKWRLKNYEISSDSNIMKRKYTEQFKLVITTLKQYKSNMNQLKELETDSIDELAKKGINPEDPDLDVNRIFSIARKGRHWKNTIDGEKVVKRKYKEPKTQGKKSLNKNRDSIKFSDKHDISYHDELENQLFNSDLNQEIENRNLKNLDKIFETEQPINNEYDVEIRTPSVPQSIAQVFL